MLLLIILTIMEKEMSKVVPLQTPATHNIKCSKCNRELEEEEVFNDKSDYTNVSGITTFTTTCASCMLKGLGIVGLDIKEPAVWKKKPKFPL